MKTFKNYFMLALIITITACGGDDDGNDGNVDCNSAASIFVELSDEIETISNASVTYGNDPTEANCLAYRQAYLDYIQALKALRDCYIEYGLLEDYDSDLDAAEADVDNITCG